MNGRNGAISQVNGAQLNGTQQNGRENGFHEPTQDELERELPMVYDGQVPLGEMVSRAVQAIYAELSELAETLPNMSDSARKRTLADWVVQTKKQVVKLYAVVKWARDADVVQKAMNVTAFLMDQNQQFEDAIGGLKYAKESLDPARMRNHDLLTSLDVLTTGSYRRLPSAIKKLVVPPTPLTDEEVAKTLSEVEDAIRFRLRMVEIIPTEFASYRIADGRVHFVAPKLFEASLCVRGAQKGDGWFFVNVEFLFTVGGDRTGMRDFPRKPTGMLKRHITDEADARLAFYLPLPSDQPSPPPDVPPRPELPPGVIDAPLVRVFNFLQMMSLSYQLEILWYQAEHLRSLGWADYLTVGMSNNRQTLTIAYWIRKPSPTARVKLPPLGGTITISIVHAQSSPGRKSYRTPKERVLAELQQKAKLDIGRPSDEVEPFRFEVKWEPEQGVLGVLVPREDVQLPTSSLAVNPDDLDVGLLLRTVVLKHTEAILKAFRNQLQHGPITRKVFSSPGAVTLDMEDGVHVLRTHFCADEVVIVTIDTRTGRLSLHDTGDLAAAGRGPRFALISQQLNETPTIFVGAMVKLRDNTIIELAEQKAGYLGLRCYKSRNLSPQELQKLGVVAHGILYIQLSSFPNHYLVLVITDDDFRYALISVKTLSDTMYANTIMEDIGWLDVHRIHGEDVVITSHGRGDEQEVRVGQKRKRFINDGGFANPREHHPQRFRLETQVLRELYAYCCARVAYTRIEQQFKLRGIHYTHANPAGAASPELAHVQSLLARSIPALCVQSSDILSGAPAAEAAMPNIRVMPLNWWSEQRAQVITCVKLKYVQQPVGKRAGSSSVIRPSKSIIYDTREAIVSFLSEDVDKCVDEFLEEWARVSKIVVIAREVAQMSRENNWTDVRLLSFDLQTVEFAYAADYTVCITCTDQLSPTGGSYDLRFSRVVDDDTLVGPHDAPPRNPHDDLEPYLRNLLRRGRLASSLHTLVSLLRDTLPMVRELEDIRLNAMRRGENVDIFPKAAGWFRVLYGDLRHALDFRLMTGARVVILDSSHSLYLAQRGHLGTSGEMPPNVSLAGSAVGRDSNLLLRAIPNFQSVVNEAVQEAVAKGVVGQVAPIDIGVICSASAVGVVGRALYERVLQQLRLAGAVV
ncbi:MED14-domain-containing protein [Sparassis latifolia]